MKIANQSIIIDFTPDEQIAQAISYRNIHYENGQILPGNLFDIFPTFGQLIDYYDRIRCGYHPGYSSLLVPLTNGELTYPPVEYAIAQECFRDNCPTELRKVVLQMALDKPERKTRCSVLVSSRTRRTGMFLMAVILVKEKDTDF